MKMCLYVSEGEEWKSVRREARRDIPGFYRIQHRTLRKVKVYYQPLTLLT